MFRVSVNAPFYLNQSENASLELCYLWDLPEEKLKSPKRWRSTRFLTFSEFLSLFKILLLQKDQKSEDEEHYVFAVAEGIFVGE